MRAHKALENLKTIKPGDEKGAMFLRHLELAVAAAEKFYFDFDELPDLKFLGPQNLPYPLVYFEMLKRDTSRPHFIVIARQKEKDGPINFFALAGESPNNIMPYNLAVNSYWNEETQKYEIKPVRGTESLEINQLSQEDVDFLAPYALAHLMALCQLINCSNVEQLSHPAPQQLNKKRIKKGKLPLHQYKTLTIRHSERGGAGYTIEGDRNSPRLHLRRGHIRRHPTAGNIWVRSCAVGKKEKGEIKKDYKIDCKGSPLSLIS